MRIQIPDYFTTKTKILGLPLKQLGIMIFTVIISISILYIPQVVISYLAIPLITISIFSLVVYILLEKRESNITPGKVLIPMVLGTAVLIGTIYGFQWGVYDNIGVKIGISNDIVLKIWGVSFIMLSGSIFAKGNLLEWTNDFRIFRKSPKDASWMDEIVREFVPVERIDEDIVYLKDGGRRTVFRLTPISAHSLKDNHLKGIFIKYKEFLNSLNGEEKSIRIQLTIRMIDTSPQLEKYFEKSRERVSRLAEKEDNKKLIQHFHALEDLMRTATEKRKPMVPQFYLTINHDYLPDDDEEREIKEINEDALVIGEKAAQIGLRDIKRLNNNELATLYKGFLTGLNEISGNFKGIITTAKICVYCDTDKTRCPNCLEQGGKEPLFTQEKENGEDSGTE